jgi:hypothetical protein
MWELARVDQDALIFIPSQSNAGVDSGVSGIYSAFLGRDL